MSHDEPDPVVPGSLAALLSEVSALRLTLDSDLTVAAAAADCERYDVSAEIVDADRSELAAFAARADHRLDQLARVGPDAPVEDAPSPRRLRLAVAGPVLAAASVAAIALASLGGTSSHEQPGATMATSRLAAAQLNASYRTFRQIAEGGAAPAAVVAAAERLHQTLFPLLASTSDPRSVQRVLHILQFETTVLENNPGAGSANLLAQARELVATLTARVRPPDVIAKPTSLPLIVPPTPQSQPSAAPQPSAPSDDSAQVPQSQPQPPTQPQTQTHKHKGKSKAAPSASPSPSPTPTPTWVWPFGFGSPRLP